MTSKMIVMVYDCEYIINETLLSYLNVVDKVFIFLDRKSNSKTMKKVVDFSSKYAKVYLIHFDFTDFDTSRNYCLTLSKKLIRTDWVIFVDDSYIFKGEINWTSLDGSVYNVLIKDDYNQYKRILIFLENLDLKYSGKIHEHLDHNEKIKDINTCWIYDYKNEQSIKRSFNRVYFMLENTDNIHYKSMGYLQLILMRKIDFKTFKDNFVCRCGICLKMINTNYSL